MMAVTDLTGTKWLLNETIEYDSSFPTYDINFNAYCESDAIASLSGLCMEAVPGPDRQRLRPGVEPPVPSSILYCLRYNSSDSIDFWNFWIGNVLYTGDNTPSMTNSANNSTFNAELFNRTIEITGGTDVTNSDLIAWLQANATQIIEPTPTETNIFSIGNLPIDNIYFGDLPVMKVYLGDILIYEAKPVVEDSNFLLNNGDYLYCSDGSIFDTRVVTVETSAGEVVTTWGGEDVQVYDE